MGLNTWAKAFSLAPPGPHAEKTCNKLIRNSFHEKFLEKWTWDLSAASAEKYPKTIRLSITENEKVHKFLWSIQEEIQYFRCVTEQEVVQGVIVTEKEEV